MLTIRPESGQFSAIIVGSILLKDQDLQDLDEQAVAGAGECLREVIGGLFRNYRLSSQESYLFKICRFIPHDQSAIECPWNHICILQGQPTSIIRLDFLLTFYGAMKLNFSIFSESKCPLLGMLLFEGAVTGQRLPWAVLPHEAWVCKGSVGCANLAPMDPASFPHRTSLT